MEILIMDIGRHMEEDEIERYSMRKMSEEESAPFEEHLLACDLCRDRIAESDVYVSAMRRAASLVQPAPQRPPARFWGFHPVWAVALGSVAAIGVLVSATDFWRAPPPLLVSLQAIRGSIPGAQTKAGQRLSLLPNLSGLAAHPFYRLEVVDAAGKQISAAEFRDAPVTIRKLAPGIYFVRLSSPGGDLLREYSLEAVR